MEIADSILVSSITPSKNNKNTDRYHINIITWKNIGVSPRTDLELFLSPETHIRRLLFGLPRNHEVNHCSCGSPDGGNGGGGDEGSEVPSHDLTLLNHRHSKGNHTGN